MIELGQETAVDLLLFAGDIFDHNRVKAEFIEMALEQMEASSAPVVILPGNHDCLLDGGVYDRGQFDQASQVRVIGLDGAEVVALHGLGVTAWGRPHRDHHDLLPLQDPPAFDPNGWRLAMAHGHLVQTDEDNRRAYRIFPDDLDAQQADYIALGHWDVYTEPLAGGGRARYSGSPLYAGTVNLVDLHPEAGLTVRRIPLGGP